MPSATAPGEPGTIPRCSALWGRRPIRSLSSENKRPRVGFVDAGEDLDKGGLPRAVLTDDGVDLTRFEVAVRVVQDDGAVEGLRE